MWLLSYVYYAPWNFAGFPAALSRSSSPLPDSTPLPVVAKFNVLAPWQTKTSPRVVITFFFVFLCSPQKKLLLVHFVSPVPLSLSLSLCSLFALALPSQLCSFSCSISRQVLKYFDAFFALLWLIYASSSCPGRGRIGGEWAIHLTHTHLHSHISFSQPSQGYRAKRKKRWLVIIIIVNLQKAGRAAAPPPPAMSFCREVLWGHLAFCTERGREAATPCSVCGRASAHRGRVLRAARLLVVGVVIMIMGQVEARLGLDKDTSA